MRPTDNGAMLAPKRAMRGGNETRLTMFEKGNESTKLFGQLSVLLEQIGRS